MKKFILVLSVLSTLEFGQNVTTTTIQSTDLISNSRTDINNNFTAIANLLNVPTTRGDLYYRGASGIVRLALGTNGQCLGSNGTDAVWGSCGVYTPDGEAAILIDNGAHTIGIASFIARLSGANVWTGSNSFDASSVILPHKTVATLPAASSNNKKLFVVTDGNSTSDCTVGSGSNKVLCESNGSVYGPVGNGG
jgi:hypothetical protein